MKKYYMKQVAVRWQSTPPRGKLAWCARTTIRYGDLC